MTTQDQKFWENYFKVYDTLNEFIPYQDLIKDVVAAVDPQPGDVILDVGCGTGNLGLELTKCGAKVVGIDYAQAALDICRVKVPTMEIQLCDLNGGLYVGDKKFNKVVSVNTFYTLSSSVQRQTIRSIREQLSRDGFFVLADLKKGWNPTRLYYKGIQEHIVRKGFVLAVKDVVSLLRPSMKILKYNRSLTSDQNYNNMSEEEHRNLLESNGFYINKFSYSYGGEAILTVSRTKE